jgi:(1->4)-alpha-D-glucan 1-alpha-D-glucosylmutase
MESSIFDFLSELLLQSCDSQSTVSEPFARERLRFAMRFQQYTAPVQAKGVEDTAFYRYHVLISANDVGGDPGRPSVAPERFHASNRQRLIDWPLELLATTTHDTKRAEDARARINVLSEMPEEWRKNVSNWMRINRRNRVRIHGDWVPDRNDEYLFYQALVGAWPAESLEASVPERAPDEMIDRLAQYMAKAIREAKVHTSWIRQNAEYGGAVDQFVRESLGGQTATRFLIWFVPFSNSHPRASPTSTRGANCGTSAWWIPTIGIQSTFRRARFCSTHCDRCWLASKQGASSPARWTS